MFDWKSGLIEARYLATLPIRRVSNARRAKQGVAPVMILFYHRVADDYPNGWSISNALFERQIDWIRDRFDIVSLAECQRRLRSGNNQRPSVAITFDDGYADNCAQALPFLIRNQIPCTYFVTVNAIKSGEQFPHDVEAKSPSVPNTVDEIQQLSNAGIEIGSHGLNHVSMASVQNHDSLRDEIAGAKSELEQIIGRPVNYFAFPFGLHGNMSGPAIKLAVEAGYHGVCSAYGGYNFPCSDGKFFHMKRIHADPEMSRLKNWLTVDSRKVSIGEPKYIDEALTAADTLNNVCDYSEETVGAE